MTKNIILDRLAAIRECAWRWREEQSRAIDEGDAVKAARAEKCAHRFEAYLAREPVPPRGMELIAAADCQSTRNRPSTIIDT